MSVYDGDVKLRFSEDGGLITFTSGQPEMEHGLWTAVYISLFTERGWWGNSLAASGEELGSDLPELMRGVLSDTTRQDMEEAARKSLKWMVDNGVAKSVTAACTILSLFAVVLEIVITEPDGTEDTYRYRVNWQGQRAALGVS